MKEENTGANTWVVASEAKTEPISVNPALYRAANPITQLPASV